MSLPPDRINIAGEDVRGWKRMGATGYVSRPTVGMAMAWLHWSGRCSLRYLQCCDC